MSLKQEYRDVLIGFEKFSFTEEQVAQEKYEFEWAKEDLTACKKCQPGDKCRTRINYNEYVPLDKKATTATKYHKPKGNYYLALDKEGCVMYKRPSFAMHKCLGSVDRAANIERAITEKYHASRQYWQDRD